MERIYQKIAEKHQDIAGKWYARVVISNEETIFLKFDHNPSVDEIKQETAKYCNRLIEQENNELEEVNRQISELQARKIVLEQKVSKP